MYTYRGIEFFVPTKVVDGYESVLYSPTEARIKNLIDMAASLRKAPPPKFDMTNYCDFDYSTNVEEKIRVLGFKDENLNPAQFFNSKTALENSCGTSACAIGTAAWNGIGKPHLYDDWEVYAYKAFGLGEGEIWSFIFDMVWYYYDNTSEGAAARILKLVIDGPRKIDYYTRSDNQYKEFKEVKISDL